MDASVPTDLSDDELVCRVRAGDAALFGAIMRRHNPRLYRVARAIVRDDAEAEDVLQQAYLSAYLHLGQFAGAARFSTWLTRIVVNEASARLRRRRAHARVEEVQAASEAPTPEAQAMDREMIRALEAAIDGLPEIYRTVLVLREVEGASTAETAAVLDISEETVKVRLHRARALLDKVLYARLGEAFGFQGARCDRVVAAVLARLGVV